MQKHLCALSQTPVTGQLPRCKQCFICCPAVKLRNAVCTTYGTVLVILFACWSTNRAQRLARVSLSFEDLQAEQRYDRSGQ